MRPWMFVAILAGCALAAPVLERELVTAPAERSADAASPVNAAGATALRKADDGHFWAEASVDGSRVRFLVDTGASVVALTPQDAKRIGVDEDELAYTQPIDTANGRVMAAHLMLKRVSVGGIEKRDVRAVVVPAGLSHSLLGMSYLGQLSRMEATPDALILRR